MSPEALTEAGEIFEERDDFVIVKRVLRKDEIEAYTAMSEKLRGESYISRSATLVDVY